jgi:hypothetical protein
MTIKVLKGLLPAQVPSTTVFVFQSAKNPAAAYPRIRLKNFTKTQTQNLPPSKKPPAPGFFIPPGSRQLSQIAPTLFANRR